jgi:hypothetical protein
MRRTGRANLIRATGYRQTRAPVIDAWTALAAFNWLGPRAIENARWSDLLIGLVNYEVIIRGSSTGLREVDRSLNQRARDV